jgi:hypothetical protein
MTKTTHIVLAAISLCLLAGCATESETSSPTVLAGMSRNDLKFYCGEPLRVESGASGSEDWYYRFSSWQPEPTGEAGTSADFGQQTSYVSGGLQISKQVLELPVHVSAEGFVVPPVPKGKIVKN